MSPSVGISLSEHLLCAEHADLGGQSPCTHGTHVLVERQAIKKQEDTYQLVVSTMQRIKTG